MNVVSRALGEVTSRPGRVYVIRNSWIESTWKPANRRTIDIAGQAIATLIQTQGLGDLFRIYQTAQRDNLDFNLALIGADFKYPPHEQFDTAFMQALFEYGYDLGAQGYPWKKVPPGWDSAAMAGDRPAADPLR